MGAAQVISLDTFRGNTRRPLFPRGPGLGLQALALSLLSLCLILADDRTQALRPARGVLAYALQPLLWAAQAPQSLGAVSRLFESRESLRDENRALRDELLRVKARLSRVNALEAENRRIRELLASSAQLKEKVLIAEILSASQDPYKHQIVLNKGARDGVYRGQALVDADGVMGQVIEVYPTTCTALLVTDPDHGIPVQVNRTGLQTVALGRGDGTSLSLPFLPGNADVKVGDLIVSSALGGRFPAGYPVGRIAELRYQAGEHFMEAIAYPAAHLQQTREALLVWSGELPAPEPGEAPK